MKNNTWKNFTIDFLHFRLKNVVRRSKPLLREVARIIRIYFDLKNFCETFRIKIKKKKKQVNILMAALVFAQTGVKSSVRFEKSALG